MSDWRKMYGAVEQTYRETAQLFMDLDGLLEARGLVVATGRANTLGAEQSASLAKPSFWHAGWLSRHYGPPGATLADARWFVAVLLCAREKDDVPPLDEPVITAGVLATSAPGMPFWVAKAWGWEIDRPTDGRVVSRGVGQGSVNTTVRCFARPVSAVRSSDDLVKEVVEPLLKIAAP